MVPKYWSAKMEIFTSRKIAKKQNLTKYFDVPIWIWNSVVSLQNFCLYNTQL